MGVPLGDVEKGETSPRLTMWRAVVKTLLLALLWALPRLLLLVVRIALERHWRRRQERFQGVRPESGVRDLGPETEAGTQDLKLDPDHPLEEREPDNG